jgi:hypothetical protein
MRKNSLIIVAGAFAAIGACSKTENGDVVLKTPSLHIRSHSDTLHPPTVTTKTETVNTPVVGTQKETLIVNKPVFGTKKSEVQVPVVHRP